MSEKRMAAAIPTLTAVNVRIMVLEMASGGRPRLTCDHLHHELSAGVSSPKEGSLRNLLNQGNDDHKLSIER